MAQSTANWRSILTENWAADVDYRWSVNPYRGCAAACEFCDTRGDGGELVAFPDAAIALREAFEHPSWEGETVTFSGLTDAYQAREAELQLTRACLEVCLRYRNPVRILTKMTLVERDLDLLRALAKEARLHVDISVAFVDEALALVREPGAPPTAERLRVVSKLAQTGLSVGVMIAPIFVGVNDAQVEPLLERAAAAGARSATWSFARAAPPVASSQDRLTLAWRATCERIGLEARPCRKRRELATTFSRTKRQLSLL